MGGGDAGAGKCNTRGGVEAGGMAGAEAGSRGVTLEFGRNIARRERGARWGCWLRTFRFDA